MNNIPIFTGVHGMATLILKEISHSGRAYVLLRSVWNGQTAALLQECAQFCRAVGAEEIFASDGLNPLPAEHAYNVVELSLEQAALPAPGRTVTLEPLTRQNAAAYLELYNSRFRNLHGAASYDRRDMDRLMGKNLAFLTKCNGRWAGIAELGENYLEAVAVLPEFRGLGHDLTIAALSRLPGPVVRLKVADTNETALRLYRRLGFGGDKIVSAWWRL